MVSLSLLEALRIERGAVAALAGGGGKTSLMWALAREASAVGWRVLSTTTTRIRPPAQHESPRLLLIDGGTADPLRELAMAFAGSRHVTAASRLREDGKLEWLEPQLVDAIAKAGLAELIVVEADGAAGRPLKAAREGEPVFPASTTLAVMVLGVEALGAPLDEAHVFRSALAADITGLPRGAPVDANAVGKLVLHSADKAPRQARLAVFVNKADDEARRHAGAGLAHELIARTGPRLERVVVGSLAEAARGFAVFEK